jgi:DNA-binding GntR family transcriptional regulator
VPATVDPNRPEPLYKQLAGVLREQIRTGKLTGRVPSVKSLQQEYEVAQGTAERALGILRAEGLVVSIQGRGHFVVE